MNLEDKKTKIIKKVLLWILGLSIGCLVCLFLFISSIKIEWGHHFNFENNTSFEVDSLRVMIGDKENWLYPSVYEAETWLEANLEVPEQGYPANVEIFIYHGGGVVHKIQAQPFNCYNCDGSHGYIMYDDKAVYEFYN